MSDHINISVHAAGPTETNVQVLLFNSPSLSSFLFIPISTTGCLFNLVLFLFYTFFNLFGELTLLFYLLVFCFTIVFGSVFLMPFLVPLFLCVYCNCNGWLSYYYFYYLLLLLLYHLKIEPLDDIWWKWCTYHKDHLNIHKKFHLFTPPNRHPFVLLKREEIPL